MNSLVKTYDSVKSIEKRPFNIEDITDALMAEPLKIDIGIIIHTPETVSVQMSKHEYTEKRIGQTIMRQFNTTAKCLDDYIVFKEA